MNKILIWGTGELAREFIKNQNTNVITGFIESNKSKDIFMGKPVYDSNELPVGYDYIIVANSYTMSIYNLCIKLNIDLSRVIFLHKVNERIGCVEQSILKQVLSEKNYMDYCIEFGLTNGTFVDMDALEYQKLNNRKSFDIQEQYMWPIIKDKDAYAGGINNYFLQDLWAARRIIRSGVSEHFDIGSRMDGFISHLLAADINVTMIDVRKFPGEVENLHTIVDDATTLHQIPDDSMESISALCSLEHFGLGRYGDTVNPEACFICFENIQKKLKKGGRLYLSVPVGRERVEFNAHRVFFADTIISCFAAMHLEEYSCAAEKKIEYNVPIHKYDEDQHNGEFRYGLFSFIK